MNINPPSLVLWFATEKCDVGCKHCCYPPLSGREPGTDEAKLLISNVAKLGAKYFAFIGGEPLLRKDITDLVKYCINCRLKPYIVTKGGRLAGGEAEKLAKDLHRLGVKITVAVDGVTHSVIDAICGKPEIYDRIMNTIKVCLKHNILQGFVTAALKPNISEIPLTLDLASKINLERCVIFGIRPTGRGRSTFNMFAPSPLEYEEFMRKIALEARRGRWRQEVFVYDPLFMRILKETSSQQYSKICRIVIF
ncbi:MAG: radical SAM protein [Candidatus Methanomethylicia archaeon]